MKIYRCLFSGDEFGGDSYQPVLVDNIAYEMDCKVITEGAVDVDIGANASAEETSEQLEDGATQVINLVKSASLQKIDLDKKGYMGYLKKYMKRIKEYKKTHGADPEEIDAFEKNAAVFAKKILANFKDYDIYVGETLDFEGMMALLNYREDGVTPFFTIWKDGVKEEKV